MKHEQFQPLETGELMGHYMSRQIHYDSKRYQIYYKSHDGMHEFGLFKVPILQWLNTKWQPGDDDSPVAVFVLRKEVFPDDIHDFIWMNFKALCDNSFKALKEKEKHVRSNSQ